MNQGVQKSNHVVYITQDGHLHELYYTLQGGWKHSDLSARSNAAPAVGTPTGYRYDELGTQHVLFRGADNHIHEIYYQKQSGWKHSSISARAGASLASGDPFGYTFHVFKSQQVVYRGQDNHINELYWVQSGGWRTSKLTVRANAPTSAGDPSAYIFRDQNNVIYRGSDNHIHCLNYTTTTDWKHIDLSARMNAPPANSNPSGLQYHVYNSQHVFYVAHDGHIQEFYWTDQGGWKHSDLTARANATPATGNIKCYVWGDQNHIVYRGVDSNIHELYYSKTTGWKHTNLSQITRSPQAIGDPIGHTYAGYNSQHVMYQGNDGNIHELYYIDGQGWKQSNLTQRTNSPNPSGGLTGYTYELK